jgi:hypothetical protein
MALRKYFETKVMAYQHAASVADAARALDGILIRWREALRAAPSSSGNPERRRSGRVTRGGPCPSRRRSAQEESPAARHPHLLQYTASRRASAIMSTGENLRIFAGAESPPFPGTAR